MDCSNRSGITRVELIVVIIAVAMLMCFLLMPSVGGPRAVAGQTDCANRLKQIALAMLSYEESHKSFPGYVGPSAESPATGRTAYRTPWILSITEYMDRSDLWAAWNDPAKHDLLSTIYWDQMVCPSNPPSTTENSWLSYVVNCGRPDDDAMPPDLAPNGVCFNLYLDGKWKKASPGALVRTTLKDLDAGKGAAVTVLASENTLPGMKWVQTSDADCEQYTGFVWQNTSTPNAAQRINGNKGNMAPPMAGTALMDYARPASNHPGVVNAVFADGHARTLREDMDYHVYQTLMATDPAKVEEFQKLGPPVSSYRLRESDY